MCSPSALRPENSFSFASEPITATRASLHLVFHVVEAALHRVSASGSSYTSGSLPVTVQVKIPVVVLHVGLLIDFGSDMA